MSHISGEEISFGFDATVYTTSENQGMVQVRIVVQTPSTGGTPRPFSVSVSTTDDTAGTYVANVV